MRSLLRALLPARPRTPRVVGPERRRLALPGGALEYEVRRSSRRSLSLRVDEEGAVRVAVPLRTTQAEIEAFVGQHRDWLLRQLSARAARPDFEAVDGASFPLLGRPCLLRVDAGRKRSAWAQDEAGHMVLRVGEEDPAGALLRALKRRALEDYAPRLAEHCARFGVAVPPLRLTSARTRWGSCSTRSGIRLHWRLIHLEPELIDYVVAHEVAHLAEMNHSPRFWRLVETLHPQWQLSRRRLHAAGAELPRI